ncbi:hypothetical protein EBT16_12860, partial [bacterium]|nr:hypothetical protein [bacterium]
RVMTGSQAFKAKLIDGLGGIEDALKEAKKAANLPEKAPVEYLETPKKGLLRELISPDEDESLMGKWAGAVDSFFQSGFGTHTGWRILLLAPIQ